MNLKSLVKNLREMGVVGRDLAAGRYPRFVYGSDLGAGEIPVFGFHSVEPRSFETLLAFLSQNRYRALSADEVCGIVEGRQPLPTGRTVALTFDDGMGSVWAVAYPLLKKYDLKATVFLISEWIPESEGYLPNLDDVWAGRAEMGRVLGREQNDSPLLSWSEIRRMHESGIVDFQSHTATHALIPIGPEIVTFVSPTLLERYQPFEFVQATGRGTEGAFDGPELGTPLYRSAPRMSRHPRCLVSDAAPVACVAHVLENGERDFFRRQDWERELRSVARRASGKSAVAWESPEEQREAMRWELQTSKVGIAARLDRGRVDHLCYPWGIGSDMAVRASCEVGYRSNFWGKTEGGGFVTMPGSDPYRIARMGEDFAWLLPGSGRQSLAHLLFKKLKRRVSGGSPYLTH